MGVITRDGIIKAMEKRNLQDRLIVTPLSNPSESIGTSSIDVKLGNQFIVMQRQSFPYLDVAKACEIAKNVERYQQLITIKQNGMFILHPRQFALGSTFEYIQIPKGLMAYVIGKSTLGRMGLIIATATKVDPGFKGCITLEIINDGEVPIVLRPRMSIAQLVIHETTGNEVYQGKYDCPIGPQFPKFHN